MSATMNQDDVLMILRNVGIDVTCGACMEIAFTSATTNVHTCELWSAGDIPTDDAFQAIVRTTKASLPLTTSEDDLRLNIAKRAWSMALKWCRRWGK